MKILKKVMLTLIHTIPCSPIEVGGVIGGKGQVITHCVFDPGGQGYGIYSPDVEYLNRVIQEWKAEEISFYGLFHSHYPKADTLSNGDKQYITTIMDAMEGQANVLYFPIVIPNSHIAAYLAYKDTQGVHIVCDKIEII